MFIYYYCYEYLFIHKRFFIYICNYLIAGTRSHTRRGSLVTLILGIVLGFSSALLFISSPSRTFTFPEYNTHRGHNDGANDPHNGHDLWDASGPIADVG